MIKLFAIVAIVLFLQMCVVWLLYRRLHNPSVVDVSWSLGLMVAGLIYLCAQTPCNWRLSIIASLLILWALRLAGFLWFTRIRKGHVDKRYQQLSKQWKIAKSLGFFLNFQLQALFILILSIVFLFAGNQSPATLSPLDLLACSIVLLGTVLESIADWQLYQYRQLQPGKLCDVGFWYYSRHPNYFFEWCIWLGFALFGLHHTWGWLGLISPLWLYIIFSQMTIPITERGSAAAKGQVYLDYQASTSSFIPWFKKNA